MATVITLPRRTVITTTDSEVHGCFRVPEKETFQLGEQAKLSQPCRAHNTSVPVALFRKVWQYKKNYSQNIYSCKSQIYIFCTCMCLVWITCKAMQQMNRPLRLGHRVVMSTKPWSLPELYVVYAISRFDFLTCLRVSLIFRIIIVNLHNIMVG